MYQHPRAQRRIREHSAGRLGLFRWQPNHPTEVQDCHAPLVAPWHVMSKAVAKGTALRLEDRTRPRVLKARLHFVVGTLALCAAAYT